MSQERFRAVSIVDAGPMQELLHTTPRASRVQARELLIAQHGADPQRVYMTGFTMGAAWTTHEPQG